MKRSSRCPLALVFALSLAGALLARSSEAVCFHNQPALAGGQFTVDYPGTRNGDGSCSGGWEPNRTPSTFAALYYDMKEGDAACAQEAFGYFVDKLETEVAYAERGGIVCSLGPRPTNPFQAWLSGATVAAVYRTAVLAFDQGRFLDDTLMQRFREQLRSFATPQDLPCGSGPGGGNNTCTDDIAVAAAGYGWAAAYEAKKGRLSEASGFAQKAQSEIHRSLTPMNEDGSVCFLRKGTNPSRCDAGFAELDAGTARVVGGNHGYETPSYGFGLMTSIAAACRGLKVARAANLMLPDTGCAAFTTNELRIARELQREAQQKTFFVTHTDGSKAWEFKPTACMHLGDNTPVHCGEPVNPNDPYVNPNYSPLDAPLKRFYDAMGITTFPIASVITDEPRIEPDGHVYSPDPGPAFQFDIVDPRLYSETDPLAFFGPLRRLFYAEEAFEQWPQPSPQAFVYWMQTAERAGFGPAGTLTVAGGATRSDLTVRLWWRDVTTGSGWTEAPLAALPDPNGAPTNAWYNTVPGPIDRDHRYEVLVQQNGGTQQQSCSYLGRELSGNDQIWWCQPPVARFAGAYTPANTFTTFEERVSPPERGIANWTWTFGDGNLDTTSGPSVVHGYGAAGIYNSRLTVTDSANRTGTTGEQVFAGTSPLDPNIAANCSNRTCTFTAEPPGPGADLQFDSWTWNFGDGSAPVSTPSGTTTYTYPRSGLFTVRLTVTRNAPAATGPHTASTVRHIYLDFGPSASFTSSCSGRTCTFDPAGASDDLQISGRVWDFGDGTSGQSVRLDHTIIHTFGGNGSYTVRLTVYDSTGQSAFTSRLVSVTDSPPTASFTVSCPSLTCTFNGSASTDDVGIATYFWSFGDGQGGFGPAQVNHQYASAGSYTVQLTVTDTVGQTGSTTRPANPANPDQPPTASFTVSCPNLTCTFNGSGSADDHGIVSYGWSFGDGQGGSGVQPSHSYASAGSYTVQLTVTDTVNQTGTTSRTANPTNANQPPTAAFTVSCIGRRCDVDGGGSTDDVGVTSWSWSFGDGTAAGSGSTGTHTYASNGSYTITLTVRDAANASGSVAHGVSVADDPPHAGFYVVCVGRTCYPDAETSGDDYGIVNYTWSWGDGATTSGSNSAPNHTYTGNGPYTITLTVRDISNQTDVTSHVVSFDAAPTAFFTMSCIGRSCDFDASGSTDDIGIAGYLWDWDDEGLSTDGPLAHHNYPYDGTFTVRLTVYDTTGHTGAYQRTVSLTDAPPFASFFVVCVGRTCSVDAENASDDNGIANYEWNWGDGAITSGSNPFPSHTYGSSNTFTITLTVSDIVGQTATTSRVVVVDQAPTAFFTAQCSGRTCSVNGSGSSDPDGSIASYLWDWGDEHLSTSGPLNSHTFDYDGFFTIVLTVTDNTGNTGRFERSYDTSADDMEQPGFTPTCSNLTCSFNAGSSTAGPAVESYRWEWGDGSGATGGAVEHHAFPRPGQYTVTLTVADNAGHSNHISKRLRLRASGAHRHTPGTARLDTPTFRLRDTNDATSGTTNASIAGAKGRPLAGDWNGDGIDTVGRYDDATSTFKLRNANKPGPANATFVYGPPGGGWLPVTGDWDGNGTDTVGLYDPETGTFHLRNSNSAGPDDDSFGFLEFGGGWRPIAGDWDGDGIDTVGLYDPGTGGFHLRTSNSTGQGPDLSFIFAAPDFENGGAVRQPIVGDWNGDGWDSIGAWDPATDRVYLRNLNDSGAADVEYTFGGHLQHGPRERMVAGDWDGL